MSLPAIEVSALSKRYVIQHEARHDNLRDTLHHTARKLWRRLRWRTGFNSEEFWALRDASFTIQTGEVVGIIGRNGAGKSTLLKILSRITEPTSGKITLRGRVASLLEVGTGFHPDLSGRENIYLNGAILGMKRAEISRKFDEIVAFAEVERFLDTPVKRYSSGMYVRLAFAVAAHLEPEILIVDEVLSVGDQQFQEKCLGKIRSIAGTQGRTVLFVSHNLLSVQQLCSRVIRLADGRVAGTGSPESQIKAFLGGFTIAQPVVDLTSSRRGSGVAGRVRYVSASLPDRTDWQLPFGERLRLRLELQVEGTPQSLDLGVSVFTLAGVEISSTLSSWSHPLGPVGPGRHRVEVVLPPLPLAPGTYRIALGVRSEQAFEDHLPEALEFQVVPARSSIEFNRVHGLLLSPAEFTLHPSPP